MKPNKYLICDTGQLLHSTAYVNAIIAFLTSIKADYSIFSASCTRKHYFAAAYEYCRKHGFTNIIFVTLEQVNHPILLFHSLKSIFSFGEFIHIYGFYFKYSNLTNFSLKSILIKIAFLLFPYRKIIISRPFKLNSFQSFPIAHKIAYAPDFFLDSESVAHSDNLFRPDTYMKSMYNISSTSFTVAFVGLLNEKKSLSKLVNSLCRFHKDYLKADICIILAGVIDSNVSEEICQKIEFLVSLNLVKFMPCFLSDIDFYKTIHCADATWCVQSNFSNSSGVFTRSAAWGTIPIVNEQTIIGKLCKNNSIGHCLPSLREDIIQQSIVALSKSKNSTLFRTLIQKAKNYVDLNCSERAFYSALNSIL